MNNEPVAWGWYDLEIKKFFSHWDEDLMENKEGCIPLYTHPAKTQELLKEIQGLKEKLMMEEESYILLDEELLCAKEAIKQQQVKIEVLKEKTLTDEEIIEVWGVESIWDDKLIDFARAILRKAQGDV